MHRTWTKLSLAAAAVLAVAVGSAPILGAEKPADRIGTSIADFKLEDYRGKPYRLSDFADKPVVVVVFLGTDCPLARLYAPRLAALAEELQPQGVAFLAIDSNRQDSVAAMAAFARWRGLEFPFLKDAGNKVADQFGAERTPEAFVLDRDRVIRYAGRIDDQYGFQHGVGYQRPEATRHDLKQAVSELLAGGQASTPVTDAPGCIIGRVRTPDDDAEVTYSNQIARIFQDRCLECHREKQVAPFALTSYDEAIGWGEMIREVVQAERMPPWSADPRYGRFLNDARLSDEEKQLIYDWVDAGCPEGDPADLPEPREFAEGWTIQQPDQVIYMSDEPVDVPAEGVVEYQYYEVDPGWTEDKWIKAAEGRPGNREVVHHIIVFIKEPGSLGIGPGGLMANNLLAGYAPGIVPQFGYPGMARRVPAGSKLVFQMHYTPNGTPQKDRSSVGVAFADPSEVTHDVRSGFAINFNIDIPPGVENHELTASRRLREDTLLLSMMPHMHLRGKSFRYDAHYPDGTSEILLNVPRYDFNWQLFYVFEEPKLLPKGTQLVCTAVYDNSENNLSNPDPTQRVRWGDQTWDEMLIGWYVAAAANQGPPDTAAKTSATTR